MKESIELVIINGKDLTDKVVEYSFTKDKCLVRFTNSSKSYPYKKSNVTILSCKRSIDIDLQKIIVKDRVLDNLSKALDFGEIIKVYFKDNKHQIYSATDIKLKHYCSADPNSKDILNYFSDLSNHIGLKNNVGISILSHQFKRINSIDEDNLVSKFIRQTKITPHTEKIPLEIYPFGLNASQKTATFCAFSNNISIIEGPPGTGKTQTILNIIANIILQKKTVAVVSGNNSATANVLEKLNKNNLEFICASLGNKENKTQFIQSQANYPEEILNWQRSSEEISTLENSIIQITEKLDQMLNTQNQIAILRQSLGTLEKEKEYFDEYFLSKYEPATIKTALFRPNTDQILQLWLECESFLDAEEQTDLWFKLKSSLLYGIESWSFYDRPISEIIPLFQDLYYGTRKREFLRQIKQLEKLLENYSFKEQIQQLTEKSMELFKARLADRYGSKDIRKPFDYSDLQNNSNAVIEEYPVILSTTHSIQTSLASNHVFDYVIVDEASQVDLLTGVLALSIARNAVIVGDLKQLPNVISQEDRGKVQEIQQSYKIPHCFDFCEHSLLSSISAALPEIPRTILREHYRCHPKIIEFCNKKFYDNQLIVMTKDNDEKDTLSVYYTVPGNHARERKNQRQIDIIEQEIIPKLNIPLNEIGVVTPYRNQANIIVQQTNVEADTVHKYQGREKDYIIISTVDNQIGEFADNPNMLNVAVSRAVKKLIVVISPDEYNENTNTGDLIKYIKYQNFEVINSKIYSVFDMLYKAYAEKRKEFLKRHKKVSLYDSENLMSGVINYILAEEPFKNLDVTPHKPLYEIIRDTNSLTNEEKRYYSHPNTHVDFIIFNKMDQIPLLAIEVDGVTFHQKGSFQNKRDQLKDSILSKCNISLLRFSTDGSGEEEKLRHRLFELTQN